MKQNWIKAKLLKDQPVLGPFCKMAEPAIYELIGLAGFDFAIIDLEHGPLSYETAQNLVRACELNGTSPIIRVPHNEEHYILRALDIGAHGVEVPEINTKEQAEKLAKAARYYPEGNRGLCCYVRAAEYSRMPKADYFSYANGNTLVIAHLEGREGLANLDEILEVEGIDVIFIGPYDMSQSFGMPGEVHHPLILEKMNYIVERARARGKSVGTIVGTPEDARLWVGRGVTYVAYSVDVGMIYEKFSGVVQAVGLA